MNNQYPPPPGGAPGYPPQGQYQQPQQPQYQQPQTQQYQQPPVAPHQPQQMQQPQQAQQFAAPQTSQFDETAAQAALAQSQQEMTERQNRQGTFPQYLKVFGPTGQTSWDHTVPVGYVGQSRIHLCPPWDPSHPLPFIESVSHFYKSAKYPRGKVVTCSDDDSCLVCQGRKLALESTDPAVNKAATSWGKKRRQFVYNVIDLDNPQGHYYQDGLMRPLLFSCGAGLQADIGRLFTERGIGSIVDYANGRPLKVSKKKTGPEAINIEWSVLDSDPLALDPAFYGVTHNLWNLTEVVKPSSVEEMMEACVEMGFPVPGAPTHRTGYTQPMAPAQPQPATFQGAPQPPAPNPYAQPGMAAPYGAPAQPPAAPVQGLPAPPPVAGGAPQGAPGMPPPPPVAAPQGGNGAMPPLPPLPPAGGNAAGPPGAPPPNMPPGAVKQNF